MIGLEEEKNVNLNIHTSLNKLYGAYFDDVLLRVRVGVEEFNGVLAEVSWTDLVKTRELNSFILQIEYSR